MEEPQVRWMVFSGGKLPKIEKLDGDWGYLTSESSKNMHFENIWDDFLHH